jgi:hypothetical protein
MWFHVAFIEGGTPEPFQGFALRPAVIGDASSGTSARCNPKMSELHAWRMAGLVVGFWLGLVLLV